MLSFYAEDATPTFESVSLNRRLVCVRLGACVQKQHLLFMRQAIENGVTILLGLRPWSCYVYVRASNTR